MKYAILDDNNNVVNIAESAYQIETNWIEIPSNTPVCIGDKLGKNNAYYDSEGNLRLSPEVQSYSEKLQLEKDITLKNAQIKALTDRNDFLEDCVAEMAAIVYA